MSLFKFSNSKKLPHVKNVQRKHSSYTIKSIQEDKEVYRDTEEDISINYININMNSDLNKQEVANLIDTDSIPDYKYKYLDNVKVINLLNYIDNIGKESFKHCTNLEKIILAANPDNLIINNGAFENCISLKEFIFEGKFKYIGENAFSNCASLEKINLNGLTVVESNCFLLDFALKEVTMTSVTDINPGAFLGCKSLDNIKLCDNLNCIDSFAFSNCGLTELHLPKSLKCINGYAFEDNFKLKDVYFEHDTLDDIDLGTEIFKHCSNVYIHTKNKKVIDYCKNNRYNVGE